MNRISRTRSSNPTTRASGKPASASSTNCAEGCDEQIGAVAGEEQAQSDVDNVLDRGGLRGRFLTAIIRSRMIRQGGGESARCSRAFRPLAAPLTV